MFTPKVTGQARLLGFNYRAEYNNFRSLAARSMAQESQTMANWTNPKGLITNESAKIRSLTMVNQAGPTSGLSAIVCHG